MTSPRSERELFDFERAELANFEVWDPTVSAPAGQEKKVAFVSVRVGGVVGLNKAAREMLGNPDAVRVMFDPIRRRLGVVPAHAGDERSHRFSYSQGQVSCKKLFEHYRVEITESRRYHELQMIDDVMVVDL